MYRLGFHKSLHLIPFLTIQNFSGDAEEKE